MQNSFENKIILKEFCQKALSKFSFLNRFTQNPTPFLPKITKHDESFLLMLPNFCTIIYKWTIPEKIQTGGLQT